MYKYFFEMQKRRPRIIVFAKACKVSVAQGCSQACMTEP